MQFRTQPWHDDAAVHGTLEDDDLEDEDLDDDEDDEDEDDDEDDDLAEDQDEAVVDGDAVGDTTVEKEVDLADFSDAGGF